MIDLIIPTLNKHNWSECVKTWADGLHESDSLTVLHNELFPTPLLSSYANATAKSDQIILAFLHDDLKCLDPEWRKKILNAFRDPNVWVVGVAGAKGHGTSDLYRSPFQIPQLSRIDFISNMTDAEKHGARFTEDTEVAVIDGMAIFVRKSVLDFFGNWPERSPAGYWLYAEWLCCEVRRRNGKIMLVGIPVEHLGGQTSSRVNVTDDFQKAHEWLYNEYRDVLPWHVKRGGKF